MPTSTIPAPPDLLRERSKQLIVLLSDNSGQIAEISRAIVILQTCDTVSFDITLINSAYDPIYRYPSLSSHVRKMILCELIEDHSVLSSDHVKWMNELDAINAQLSALGMTDTL